MSFVFRGSRADIESGLPERRTVVRSLNPLQRMHAGGRSAHSDSMAFLFTVLVLFMILNSHQMSPNFMLWVVLGVFLMATGLRMYATCRQIQAQAHAHAMAASELLEHHEVRLHVPPSVAFTTRGRLHSLRLQLALLDRDFDDLDYDALRALDADTPSDTPAMTEDEINSLPVHEYRAQSRQGASSGLKSCGSPVRQASSSTTAVNEKNQETGKPVGSMEAVHDELTCSVCLEQVNTGEVVRSLPCLHQFHASCINPWLRQRGTCPICKSSAAMRWQQQHGDGETDPFDIV